VISKLKQKHGSSKPVSITGVFVLDWDSIAGSQRGKRGKLHHEQPRLEGGQTSEGGTDYYWAIWSGVSARRARLGSRFFRVDRWYCPKQRLEADFLRMLALPRRYRVEFVNAIPGRQFECWLHPSLCVQQPYHFSLHAGITQWWYSRITL